MSKLFLKALCLGLMAFSCGSDKSYKKVKTPDIPIDLIEKNRTYRGLIGEVSDAYGFVEFDHCDSLLFSGLLAATGLKVRIHAAKDLATGQWYRTPYKDCYRNEQEAGQNARSPFKYVLGPFRRSKSTISKDMFTGLFWALYYLRDVVEAKHLIAYGEKHDWVMGEGPLSRTWLGFGLIKTLHMIAGKSLAHVPDLWRDPYKDYARHLQVLHILLRGEMTGEISGAMHNALELYTRRDPKNALFQYAYHRFSDGDQTKATAILRDESLFPAGRLPTARDRCTRWLWERDSSKPDWRPCDEDRRHSGGDFIFVAWLLEQSKVW